MRHVFCSSLSSIRAFVRAFKPPKHSEMASSKPESKVLVSEKVPMILEGVEPSVVVQAGDVPQPEDLEGMAEMNAKTEFKQQFKGPRPTSPKVGVVKNRGSSNKCPAPRAEVPPTSAPRAPLSSPRAARLDSPRRDHPLPSCIP